MVAGELGDVMTRACTINEPNIVATMGWHAGMFPPGKTDKDLSYRVGANLVAGTPRRRGGDPAGRARYARSA